MLPDVPAMPRLDETVRLGCARHDPCVELGPKEEVSKPTEQRFGIDLHFAFSKSTVNSMVDSVSQLVHQTAAPPPPSALLAPPAPPKPPPAAEASGYWTRPPPRLCPPPAASIARQAKEAELLSPQTLSPWVLPAVEKVGAPSGPMAEHEAQLLGRLLQGLQESSLSVHDVMGVMELDLKRPNYGASLAETVAAQGSATPVAGAAPVAAGAGDAAGAVDACARCRVLERQIQALAQALAGLGARVFNWTASGLSLRSQKTFLWDMTQQYLQPCAHLDGRLAETCSSLAAALKRDSRKVPLAAPGGHGLTSSPRRDEQPRPGAMAAPVTEEVLVSFKATSEAKKLNGVYRRRTDLQVNGRPVYCNGNRHLLFMADGAWVIKEGPSSEEGAYAGGLRGTRAVWCSKTLAGHG
ncbi:unnamed protein product [Durusdinium trenchii]|uniref:Uncharacterized protein n=1 Tax=Durusdinium trenchii TaxID=1381693 RepID=A0ABP0SMF5_9DINO